MDHDTALSVLHTTAFALGYIILIGLGLQQKVDDWLFGNIMSMGDADLWIAYGIGAIAVLSITALQRPLLIPLFDPRAAATMGIPTRAFNYGIFALIILVLVSSLQAVGAFLTLGLLVAPAATMYLLTDRAAWLFWGRAQYNDRGDSVPSVSLSFYVGSTPDAGYMDPAAGVVPKSVALDPTYQTVHKTVTSKIVTEFSWADMEKTAIGSHYASIPLYVLGDGGSKYYAGTIEAYYENGDYLYKWTDASGAVTNFLGADHDKSTLVFTCENGGLTMVWKHDTTTWHKLDTGPADYSAVWTTAEPDKYITIKSTVEGQTTTWGDLS